jgi:hypothetical protein
VTQSRSRSGTAARVVRFPAKATDNRLTRDAIDVHGRAIRAVEKSATNREVGWCRGGETRVDTGRREE